MVSLRLGLVDFIAEVFFFCFSLSFVSFFFSVSAIMKVNVGNLSGKNNGNHRYETDVNLFLISQRNGQKSGSECGL